MRTPIVGAFAPSSTLAGRSVATIRWTPSRSPSAAISRRDDTRCGCPIAIGRFVDDDDEPRQGEATPCPLVAREELGSQAPQRAFGQMRVGGVVVHHDMRERGARSERRSAGKVDEGERDRVGWEVGREAHHERSQQFALAGSCVPPMSTCGPSRSRSISTVPW